MATRIDRLSKLSSPAPTPGALTGRRFLTYLLAFFGVMFAVNGYMTYQALTTFRGADVDSVYQASRAYPSEIAAAQRQNALGWTVDLEPRREASGHTTVRLTPRDAAGTPVTGLSVRVRLEHPTNRYLDRDFMLTETGPGLYLGAADRLEAGAWTVVVEAERGGERLYRSQNRTVLP
ncbi:MAG: FixH family protein [Labrys sp. (in: a-proteobacteria)]|jgi:nitrogen fixation protein FixH